MLQYICLLFIFILAQPISAQSDTPLIILMQGDYWAWDSRTNTLEQLTEWGYNEPGALAPDGMRIAYRALAQISIDQTERDQTVFTSDRPGNIRVLDIASGESVEIAGQPPEAAMDNPDGFQFAIIRSHPAWTADGDALIWTEYEREGSTMRAIRHDLSTGTTEVIMTGLSIGFQDAGLNLPNVAVTEKGIHEGSSFIFMNDALPGGGGSVSRLYDFGVNLISETFSGPFSLNNPAIPAGERPLVQHHRDELYSLDNPAESGTVTRTNFVNEDGQGYTRWYFHTPDGPTIELGDGLVDRKMALSPDGTTLALVLDDGVHLFSGSGREIIPGTEEIGAPHPHMEHARTYGLLWGRSGWRERTDRALTPIPPRIEATPDIDRCIISTDLFTIGMQGRVRANLSLPLNLFEKLPLNGRFGLVQPGTVFAVIGGPDCSWEGYPAWQVEFNGQVGWIVQQDSSETRAWVEPLP